MKKITAFLSALIMLTGLSGLCASAEEYLYGDVDGNGKIDILDVITLNKAILGKETLSPEAVVLADVDGSGIPDSIDSLMIIKYIVGMIDVFDVQNTQPANIYNGHRYEVFDEAMSWEEARAYCESLGGHLAAVTTQEEADYILTLTKSRTDYWLGATDAEEEGVWKWITGETWDYTNWHFDQPDNDEERENYLCLVTDWQEEWNDAFNEGAASDLGFICEWDTTGETHVEYQAHSYTLFNMSMTWTEAEAYCESLGGHLMTIGSEEETEKVLDIFSQSEKQLLWLGGYYDEAASGWKWVDGSEFNYTNWDNYAPDRQSRNGQTESYMMTYKKPNPSSRVSHSEAYKWNDIFENGCFPGEEDFFSTENYCFICEWDEKQIVSNIYNGHKYQVFDESMSWKAAEDYCESLGGHLVTITDAEEQAYLEKLLGNAEKVQYWIGLYLEEENWVWVDGSEYYYSNWDKDLKADVTKPDNMTGTEFYVRMAAQTAEYEDWSQNFGKWDDADNEADGTEGDASLRTFGFICEWDS